MRFLSIILILALTGCHLTGSETACQSCPPAGQSAECEEGTECGGSGWSNWLYTSHFFHPPKHHSEYKQIPDNFVTRTEARWLAQSNLKKYDKQACISCDYRAGYEQAFVDVALGHGGDVPALPPSKYWKSCARTPEGHAKAQQWFSGYAAGAARALSIYEPYNEVAHSQTECQDWSRY